MKITKENIHDPGRFVTARTDDPSRPGRGFSFRIISIATPIGPLTNVSGGKWVITSKSASGAIMDVASGAVNIGLNA